MSIEYRDKLRAIRLAEGLTQKQFAELTGISHSSIRNYEAKQAEVGLSILERVMTCDLLHKYSLWLMTNQSAPDANQIEPAAEYLEDGAKRKKKSA